MVSPSMITHSGIVRCLTMAVMVTQVYGLSGPVARYIGRNGPILHRFANEDVTLGAWLVGLEVTHMDERRFCCDSAERCMAQVRHPPFFHRQPALTSQFPKQEGQLKSVCEISMTYPEVRLYITMRCCQGFVLITDRLRVSCPWGV